MKVKIQDIYNLLHSTHDRGGAEHFLNGRLGLKVRIDSDDYEDAHKKVKLEEWEADDRTSHARATKRALDKRRELVRVGQFLEAVGKLAAARVSFESEDYEDWKRRTEKAKARRKKRS